MLLALLLLLGALLVLGFLVLPGESDMAQRAPFWGVNHAHRGLHSKDGAIPENSIAAFAAAVDAGYGIELDVQLSRDGEVVVFHDEELLRLCAAPGRLEELPWEALAQLRLLGTDQGLPLLRDVLVLVDMRVPLIVELKTTTRYRQLCQAVWRLLRQYDGDVCVESFDPRIVRWFRRHVPGLLRGQLASHPVDGGKTPKAAFLGWCLANFLGRPQFIAYEKGPRPLLVRLAMRFCMSVVWTARPGDDIAGMEMENDAVIFEHYLPDARYIEPPAEPPGYPPEEERQP